MTFHEFRDTMVVMDGRRAVAKARRKPAPIGWVLRACGASFTDPRARKPRFAGVGGGPGIVDPGLMAIKTRREARKILREIAGLATRRGE